MHAVIAMQRWLLVALLAVQAHFAASTKLLPIATALVILAAGLNYWSPMATR
jgi:hypothetical protein